MKQNKKMKILYESCFFIFKVDFVEYYYKQINWRLTSSSVAALAKYNVTGSIPKTKTKD